MSRLDLSPWDPSEWWIVVFSSVELAAGEARYGFPRAKATGGALVHSKALPFDRVREKWKWNAAPEHFHAYQLANREAAKVVPRDVPTIAVEKLLDKDEAVRLWNRYATDTKETP